VAGVVFFVGSFPLLWVSEGHTHTKSLVYNVWEDELNALTENDIEKNAKTRPLDELLKQNPTIEVLRDRISQGRSSTAFWRWLFRGVGLALMCFGIFVIADPFAKLIDRIPLMSRLRKRGTIQFALIVGLALTTLTISAHWSLANPLPFVAIVALVLLAWYGKSRYLSKANPEPTTTVDQGEQSVEKGA
jgi:hypothetical protein